MDHGLKYKHKSRKINTDFQYLGLGRVVKLTPIAQPLKGKNDKGDFVKIKNVCSAKDPVEDIQISYKLQVRENIHKSHIQQKTSIVSIYMDSQLNSKKANNPIRAWIKDTEISLKKLHRWKKRT